MVRIEIGPTGAAMETPMIKPLIKIGIFIVADIF